MDSLAGKETQKMITVPGMTDCNEGEEKGKETSVGGEKWDPGLEKCRIMTADEEELAE